MRSREISGACDDECEVDAFADEDASVSLLFSFDS